MTEHKNSNTNTWRDDKYEWERYRNTWSEDTAENGHENLITHNCQKGKRCNK